LPTGCAPSRMCQRVQHRRTLGLAQLQGPWLIVSVFCGTLTIHGFGLCHGRSSPACLLACATGCSGPRSGPLGWARRGQGGGGAGEEPSGNPGAVGKGAPVVPPPLPARRLAGAVPDHSLGVPMGWESGRERRRQTPEGGLRRQAGQRPRCGGAHFPHGMHSPCADGVWGLCGISGRASTSDGSVVSSILAVTLGSRGSSRADASLIIESGAPT